jgi:hypothetical protein
MRIAAEEQNRVIARDGTICRPCGNHLHLARWHVLRQSILRLCGDCQNALKARALGISGDADTPNGLDCYGRIAHGKDGPREGHWTC